jgi:hypothetical protein
VRRLTVIGLIALALAGVADATIMAPRLTMADARWKAKDTATRAYAHGFDYSAHAYCRRLSASRALCRVDFVDRFFLRTESRGVTAFCRATVRVRRSEPGYYGLGARALGVVPQPAGTARRNGVPVSNDDRRFCRPWRFCRP